MKIEIEGFEPMKLGDLTERQDEDDPFSFVSSTAEPCLSFNTDDGEEFIDYFLDNEELFKFDFNWAQCPLPALDGKAPSMMDSLHVYLMTLDEVCVLKLGSYAFGVESYELKSGEEYFETVIENPQIGGVVPILSLEERARLEREQAIERAQENAARKAREAAVAEEEFLAATKVWAQDEHETPLKESESWIELLLSFDKSDEALDFILKNEVNSPFWVAQTHYSLERYEEALATIKELDRSQQSESDLKRTLILNVFIFLDDDKEDAALLLLNELIEEGVFIDYFTEIRNCVKHEGWFMVPFGSRCYYRDVS